MAWQAAVKAGDPLSPEAQEDLIRGRDLAFQPGNCPHGRPSELFISWQELGRRFDRK
jgi:DNA mismatch repair protein MutL